MKWLKDILFFALIAILLLPVAERCFSLGLSKHVLWGSYVEPEQPNLDREQWFSGDFQEKELVHFDYNLGFRPELIKLYNQYLYSFYHKSIGFTYVGKEKELFTHDYIGTMLGDDFIGRAEIEQRIAQMERLQDSLNKLGKPMLFVLAPNKARLLSDLLFADIDMEKGSTSNYEVWRELLSNSHLEYIDFNDYYSRETKENRLDLFASTGTHWNSYAMMLAVDTIYRRLQKLDPNSTFPELKLKPTAAKDSAIESDSELINGLNIYEEVRTRPQPFFDVSFIGLEYDKMPRVLVIGDSFFWNFFGMDAVFPNLFHPDSRFWYYNKRQMDMAQGSVDSTANLNAAEMTRHLDYLIILGTEANLDLIPYGFPEKYFEDLD